MSDLKIQTPGYPGRNNPNDFLKKHFQNDLLDSNGY
jgi:hypothetical protein